MYTSDTNEIRKELRAGMIYLAVSVAVAAAAAVYGIFSHGVYSYWMTYAFMIPLILGAVPHLSAALAGLADEGPAGAKAAEKARAAAKAAVRYFSGDLQIAVIAALTAGSLLKGALDIYGTSNRLLIAYPLIALLAVAAALAKNCKIKAPGSAARDAAE